MSDKPSIVLYYENGVIKYEEWCKDGFYHRVDGPAVIKYYESGGVECEIWYKDGYSFVPSESDFLIKRVAGILWESSKEFEKFLNENNILTDS